MSEHRWWIRPYSEHTVQVVPVANQPERYEIIGIAVGLRVGWVHITEDAAIVDWRFPVAVPIMEEVIAQVKLIGSALAKDKLKEEQDEHNQG